MLVDRATLSIRRVVLIYRPAIMHDGTCQSESLYSSEVNANLQVCVALYLPEVPCYPVFIYLLKQLSEVNLLYSNFIHKDRELREVDTCPTSEQQGWDLNPGLSDIEDQTACNLALSDKGFSKSTLRFLSLTDYVPHPWKHSGVCWMRPWQNAVESLWPQHEDLTITFKAPFCPITSMD